MEPHRKRLRRFHEPGDLHELTFSVYRRQPLLTNNPWRAKLSESITAACSIIGCRLAAFVYMPEHVHLLLWNWETKEQVSDFLAQVKQPVASQIRSDLTAATSRLLERLTIQERPGKQVFRFWQEGAGYDRNLQTPQAVQAALEYIHLNPVKRGLCEKARDWRWSSARFYESDGAEIDPLLPLLSRLPYDFWTINS